MKRFKPLIIWLVCVVGAGLVLGVILSIVIKDSPVNPAEEFTTTFLDLSDEVMRIYGFEQGEMTILTPRQMVTINGVHYIHAYDPEYDTEVLYCIKENSWLYYAIYFMPKGEDFDFKQFDF